jgi:CheY-like chemotaxis protein
VLIVDDNGDARDLLRTMLHSFGASVLMAVDGEEALTVCNEQKPDLILCDLLMPVMDGITFVQRLQHNPKLARIPVIAVTALGEPDDFMRTWAEGFNAHLVKPIGFETLATQLGRTLWAHRPIQESRKSP